MIKKAINGVGLLALLVCFLIIFDSLFMNVHNCAECGTRMRISTMNVGNEMHPELVIWECPKCTWSMTYPRYK
jgi:RNase P subunit RPR2